MANANFFSPDGGITRYPLEDTEGRIMYADDIDGINLLDINLADLKSITLNGGTWNDNAYTHNGVTFTFNSEDNSIIINGTATAETDFYILKGPSGTSRPISELQSEMLLSGIEGDNDFCLQIIYRNASDGYLSQQKLTSGELAIEIPSNAFGYRICITVANGKTVTNAVVKPMLTEAKYAGIPYRPYNQQSIQHQINAQTGVLGAKNLLCYPYKNTTKIENGITFTDNGDGTITANGTATEDTDFDLWLRSDKNFVLPKGDYIATGCPAGGGDPGYHIRYSYNKVWDNPSAGFVGLPNDVGNGSNFSLLDKAQMLVVIRITSGITVTNKVFKPMIRLASDPDDTYAPFAMTNRELTEVKTITGTATNTTNNATPVTCVVVQNGKICQLIFNCTLTSGVAVGSNIGFNLTGIPMPKGSSYLCGFGGSTSYMAQITSAGVLTIRVLGTNADTGASVILGGFYIIN